MAKGGARARSGPPPDPNALRRERDGGDWVTLPAAGREGEPPAWPLSRALKRELELWASEWRRPQAVMWERNGQELEVALYVRVLVRAERRDAPGNLLSEARKLQEGLGLSLAGLARNRWRIGDTPAQAQSGTQQSAPARSSLRVVPGGAA